MYSTHSKIWCDLKSFIRFHHTLKKWKFDCSCDEPVQRKNWFVKECDQRYATISFLKTPFVNCLKKILLCHTQVLSAIFHVVLISESHIKIVLIWTLRIKKKLCRNSIKNSLFRISLPVIFHWYLNRTLDIKIIPHRSSKKKSF